MHRARAFFFVCAGIFLLALAYHFGAQSATAQAPSNPVVGIAWFGAGGNSGVAITAGGDVYESHTGSEYSSWAFRGNVFGGATPATQSTWGGVKARYRQDGTAKQDK